MSACSTRVRERGFALLIVLWTLGLLALIGTQITASGRVEARLAANLRSNAVVEAAADGAVQEAMLRLLQGVWRPGAGGHTIHIGRASVEVRLEDESAKLNPNFATLPMLQLLLRSLGLDPARAASLAAAIVDWRTRTQQPLPGGAKAPQYRAAGLSYGPPGRPFTGVDELGLVLGMTPDILARLKPRLSVYSEGDVAPTLAGSAAGQADEGTPPGSAPEDATAATGTALSVMVQATATGPGAARFTRRAVVRVKPELAADEAPYRILTWETPDG